MKKVTGDYFFIGILLLCAFVYNPLALVFPYGSKLSSYVFFFNVPHLFIASSVSLAYICLNYQLIDLKDSLSRILLAATFLSLLSGVIFGSYAHEVVEILSYFTVPFAICLAARKTPKIESFILPVISFLWLISMFYCLIWPGNGKIGFSGNQNWLAATLLSSSIFTVAWLKQFLNSKTFKVFLLLFIPLNFYILSLCEARVLYPAFIIALLYGCWPRLSKKVNFLLWGLISVAGISAFFMKQDFIQRSVNQDIRGPLYSDTLNMVGSSPFLGHGPGNFQRDFPEYASDDLKQRIVYSPIVEHPHNEFLRMAAENGLLFSCLWLFLMFTALKTKEGNKVEFYQFSTLLLLVMGMADKPLEVSSSAIIFLISVGLCLKNTSFIKKSESNSRLSWIPAALIIAFLFFRLSQVLPSEYYKWRGEQAKHAFQNSGDQRFISILNDLYRKSSEADPTAIYPQYVYANLLSRYSNNFQLILDNLQKTIGLEPYFSDINFVIAQFYHRQASLVTAAERQEYLDIAEKHFKMNLKSSPWSLKRNRELIYFYSKYGMREKALEAFKKLRQISREKLQILYTYPGKGDLHKEIDSSILEALKGPTDLSKFARSLKPNVSKSYMYPQVVNKFSEYDSYISQNYRKSDWLFWYGCIFLNEATSGINSVSELIKELSEKTVTETLPLQSPREAYGAKEISPRSLAGLITHLAYSKGWLACNFEGKDKLFSIIFADSKIYVIDCYKAKVIDVNIETLKEGKFTLLMEPQKFIMRNQLLSDLLSMNDQYPQLCKGPTEVTFLLQSKLNNRKIELDLSYFDLLIR